MTIFLFQSVPESPFDYILFLSSLFFQNISLNCFLYICYCLQGLRATPGLVDPQAPVFADSGQLLPIGAPGQAKDLGAGGNVEKQPLAPWLGTCPPELSYLIPVAL